MAKIKAIRRVAVINFNSIVEGLRSRKNDIGTGVDIYSYDRRRLTKEEIKERESRYDSDIEAISKFRCEVEENPAFFKSGEGYPCEISLPNDVTDPCRRYRGSKHLIFFKSFVYLAEGPHTEEEFLLLACRECERELGFFDSLRSSYNEPSEELQEKGPNRKRIVEKVRREVWRRDEGKCARCGSREFLEFDHIVPVSKGGSNTARNVELLCEGCNRSKSDKLG